MDDPSRKYVAFVDPQHAFAMDLLVACAKNILLVKPHLEKMERAERRMDSIGWATHPSLYEEDWTAVFQTDCERRQQHCRKEHEQSQAGETQVEAALDGTGTQSQWSNGHQQKALPAGDSCPVCRQLRDSFVGHFAFDIHAAQNCRPGCAAPGWAAYGHAINPGKKQANPV